MPPLEGNPVERAGMVAIFARWQESASEYQHQVKLRDDAAKRAEECASAIAACREACKAFGFDPENTQLMAQAISVYGPEAAKIYNETKSAHLPFWYVPAPPPPPSANEEAAQIPPPPPLETPPPPPMPKIKDIVLSYLEAAHDAELGGTRAAILRAFIEQKYSVEIHEKTVGMTLYRLLKDGKVRRKGHEWFFVPQPAATKNPGVGAPGPIEGR